MIEIKEVKVEEVSDKTWENIVERSQIPVVCMFFSPTCPHCHILEPAFDQYAEEFKKQMIFVKCNVVENQRTARRYGLMATPTFKFFCHGRPVQELVGSIYPPLLKKTVEDVLKRGGECISKSTPIDYSISAYA